MTIYFWAYVLLGVACAYFVVRADLRRRHLRASPLVIVGATTLAAVIGVKLYQLLVTPSAHLALFDPTAWFAGTIVALLVLALLSRHDRIPVLVLLDTAAPAATVSYAAALLASTLAHPFVLRWDLAAVLVAAAIPVFLWREGKAAMQWQRPNGIVLGEYLVLSGVSLWVINWYGGTQSQLFALAVYDRTLFDFVNWDRLGSVLSIIAGTAVIAAVLPRYLRVYEGHRVLEHQAVLGEGVQPEYTSPTRECPYPERWRMYDSMTAEVEVLDFLKSLITTVKPSLVVETGTFAGISTIAIAEGLRQNGFGKVVTCELDPRIFAQAKERIDASGLGHWVEYRNESSLETQVEGEIDLLFSDSEQTIREQEVRRFLPQMNPHGLILIHDANSQAKIVREAARRLEAEGLISMVLLPTPRGLVIAQKRTSH